MKRIFIYLFMWVLFFSIARKSMSFHEGLQLGLLISYLSDRS